MCKTPATCLPSPDNLTNVASQRTIRLNVRNRPVADTLTRGRHLKPTDRRSNAMRQGAV